MFTDADVFILDEPFRGIDIKAKIAMFCNVDADAVITAKDVNCIYEVPLLFHQEGLDTKIVELLNIWTRAPRLEDWEGLCRRMNEPTYEVTIAIAGIGELHNTYVNE